MPRTPTDKAVVFALKDLQREKGFFFGLSDNVTNNLNVNKSLFCTITQLHHLRSSAHNTQPVSACVKTTSTKY